MSATVDDRSADRDIEFGMEAIKAGFVQPLHLQSALRKLNERRTLGDRTSLPQILLEIGLMTKEQVKDVLKELSATSLICTNPGCGESYKVKAFDPGRKYKCAKCKSPLAPENPEDAGELTSGGVVHVTGVDALQKQIAEFYDISENAPPPPPEMINLHAPRKHARGDTDIRLAGENEEQINLEDDPRDGLSKHKPLSGEIAIAGVPLRPGKTTRKKEVPPGTIAGVPIAPPEGTPEDPYSYFSGDDLDSPLGADVNIAAAGDPDDPDDAGSISDDEAIGEDFDAPGSADDADGAGVYDEDADATKPASPAPKAARKPTAKPAKSEKSGKPAKAAKPKKEKPVKQPKPKKVKLRRGPSGLFVGAVVLLLLGAAGAGAWYVYTYLLQPPTGAPLPSVNTGSPASHAQKAQKALLAARDELKALRASATTASDETIAKIDKLIEAAPAMIEGHLFAGELLWRSGKAEAAMERWEAVIDAPATPEGLSETTGVRDEAGFYIGMSYLLSETTCEPRIAREAFAAAVTRAEAARGPDEHGDRPVVAACRALSMPAAAALAEIATPKAASNLWQLRLARGLLLATGAWPGEVPQITDDFNEAATQLRAALSEPAAVTLVQVRAFHGLLMGALVAEPRDTGAAEAAIAIALNGGNASGTGSNAALAPTAAYYRARIAFASGDAAKAEALLDGVDFPRAYLLRGRMAVNARDAVSARKLLGLVSDRLPEARLLLGRLALEMGEYSTAADLLMEAAAPMALADLGLARMLAGDGPGAVSALGKAAKMREESPERRKNDDAVIFARYSYALNATGDTNGARLAIRTAVAADRNHAELLLWRGLAELERGQPQTALDDIGRLVKNEPTMWRAWLIAGKCYLALDKKDEAAAALKKASDLVPPEAREREEITRLMRQ